jgi:hypothetical protein
MLEHLINDWLESQPLLGKHFSVVIDPRSKFYAFIDTSCQDSNSSGYPYHSRYIRSRDIYPYRIAFISDSNVKLWKGHRIGMPKEAILSANDPQFFKNLENVMHLMHKVIYGKSCQLKPSDP